MIGDLLARAVRGVQLTSSEAEEVRQTMLRLEMMAGKVSQWTVQYGTSLERITVLYPSTMGYLMMGRLTLESGVPISITDQTAKTTLYWAPYLGDTVSLYANGVWGYYFLPNGLSLSLSGFTASLPYDIFMYVQDGAPKLEALAWTSDTARATALVKQDGVYVKSGDTTRRYVGTIRTTSTTGQCEDSLRKRFVWNYYNRVARLAMRVDTDSHAYTTNAWRQWEGSSDSQIEGVFGIAEDNVQVSIYTYWGGALQVEIGLQIDDTAPAIPERTLATETAYLRFRYLTNMYPPQLGYHYWAALEYGQTGATQSDLYLYGTFFC